MERGSYKTKARNILSEEIKEFSNGFTIKELKAKLDKKNINIGLTTIYRTLELLEDEEIVKKYFDENNISKYKYVNDCQSQRHFYLKCMKCNNIIHVDCECIDDLYLHILKKHKFYIDKKNLIIPGIYDKCKSFVLI